MQHPPPALFVPVKAAVTPPAGKSRQMLRKSVQDKAVTDSVQTTPVNPYRRAAKGTERDVQIYTLLALI